MQLTEQPRLNIWTTLKVHCIRQRVYLLISKQFERHYIFASSHENLLYQLTKVHVHDVCGCQTNAYCLCKNLTIVKVGKLKKKMKAVVQKKGLAVVIDPLCIEASQILAAQ